MQVVEDLKKEREELGGRIEALRGEIAILEQQRAAFDIVLMVYDQSYRPDGAVRVRSRKPPKVPASSVTPLLKDLDKRGALLWNFATESHIGSLRWYRAHACNRKTLE